MNPLKYYCVGGFPSAGRWLRGTLAYSMDKADVVVFPGGPDVDPALYGEKAHRLTMTDKTLDFKEMEEYKDAIRMGKRIIGICRGAQLMCALAGGKLVQHQQDMAQRHPIMTYDGKIIKVSSSHHQAMYPWGMDPDEYKVLGWAVEESDMHEGGDEQEMVKGIVPLDMEVEVAFFPKIKALGIQAHPEWQFPCISTSKDDRNAVEYFQDLVQKFMDNDQFKDAHDAFAID